ncbi:hypothetical protein Mpsy_0083 [Methanolobus psychrophilus R15]|nr:hypothetical protein Mpsy_0083 [Methanolobus psychrophilus R15]
MQCPLRIAGETVLSKHLMAAPIYEYFENETAELPASSSLTHLRSICWQVTSGKLKEQGS